MDIPNYSAIVTGRPMNFRLRGANADADAFQQKHVSKRKNWLQFRGSGGVAGHMLTAHPGSTNVYM